MNKRVFFKITIITILIIILSNIFCISVSNAMGDMFAAGKAFLRKGATVKTIDTGVVKETSSYIYNTLLAIAIVVAIVVAMVLGIQFMVASADDKAKVKEAVMPFVAGCIVVFGSFTIWKVAVNIGNDAEGAINGVIIADSEDGGYDMIDPSTGDKWHYSTDRYKDFDILIEERGDGDWLAVYEQIANTDVSNMNKEELASFKGLTDQAVAYMTNIRGEDDRTKKAKQQMEECRKAITKREKELEE